MVGITKRFPGVLANDHIDFQVEKGKIHGLLGENGAGKTTLMNVLYGLYKPDDGKILLDGREVALRSPRDAINLGIGMVHQHFTLVPPFTVTENVILGLTSSKEPFLDMDKAEKKLAEVSEKYSLKVDPRAKIWQLSIGEQQRVEIIKAIYRGADILILDEPTSVLTPQEAKELFKFLRSFAKEGHAVVFISHKLNEVMAICDLVTVLRGGRVVSTKKISDVEKGDLARMMVGREVLLRLKRGKSKVGDIVLEVKNLRALNDKGLIALKGVSFFVREGEVLGMAGVAGNGQRELAGVIMGFRKAIEGKVLVGGRDVTNCPSWEVIEQGVGHIPEDRLERGLILDLSVAENAILRSDLISKFTEKGVFLDYQKVSKHAEDIVSKFDVRTIGTNAITKTLSGGNLQKLILARELSREPKLLVACDPTRGLDVGATEYIRRVLLERREKETAILLISGDLEEIFSLSDRIAVIFEGKIMGIITPEEASVEEVGLLMAGVKEGSSS